VTAELWVPGLLVLALGAAAGWWLTRRKLDVGGSAGDGKPEAASRSALEREDLRHRREELYARLRSVDLDDRERLDLELEAAKVLQRLDALESKMASGAKPPEKTSPEKPSKAEEIVTAVAPAAVPHSKARTLLTGFAFGGATTALIALLVFWAGRDATEKDPMIGQGDAQPSPRAAQPTAEQPHPVGALSPEVAAEVEQLLEHLESRPDDLAARKRLALLYLGTDQYVPAFEQAEAVLAVAPDDIDALYVQGVVRMTMGQDEVALARLDRVLELFPDHLRAMTVQGLIFARQGNREQAASLWNRALEVGGPQPEIESLLAMLDAEETGLLPPGHPGAGAPSAVTAASRGDAMDDFGPGDRLTAPGEYRVRVEADVIPGFQQTGTLFVALRTAGGGPPVAVKRIDRPTFPILVSLGPKDMMMAAGGELPESGALMVRLDQDGSASTRGENDLQGSAEVSRGDLVTIVLR